MSPAPLRILLVEDNPGDVRLTREALSGGGADYELIVARDGVEAMEVLKRSGTFSDSPRPDIIFLDLNLPRKGGAEVLAEIKSDPGLRRIPVVILTVSSAEEDICRSYDLHANCYVGKPLDFEQFMRVMNSIESFWFKTVKLPSGEIRGFGANS